MAVSSRPSRLSYEFAGDVLLHEAHGTTVASRASQGDYFVGRKPTVTSIDNVVSTPATILMMTLNAP